MGYYGVDENDIETLIGNGHEMFTSLMVDCECNMYWTSTPPIPTTIEQFQIEGYSNLRMKLESVHVLTTNDWTDFTPYNQTNYKHDLARFLGMSLTVTVHTTPIPTDPEHRMQQTYEYDGLSQLFESNDPDRGTTEMVYDQRGQLRFSQNAQQREVVDGKQRFSFVDYDGAGRTVRTGVYAYVHDDQQYMQWRGPLDPPWNVNEIFCTRTPFVLNDMPPLLVQHCEEVSSLVYDAPDPEFPTLLFPALAQRLPPGALSSSKNDESATWYSYDVRGRLHWTVHYTNGLNKYHTVKYEYDLRGQLAHVLYQEEMPEERFDHWYRYDNNGRLLRVLTGNDGLLANATEQAQHSYYAHGPLKRTELGEDLQGLDFVYTLQGWLKTMNSPDANERDPGRDGQLGSNHANFTPDLFGLALDYYNGDYARAGSKITASVLSATDQTAPQRYNGLVRAQRWNNRTMSDPGTYEQGGQNLLYAYQYDALGQRTQAQFATVNAPVQDQNSTYLPPSYTPSTNYKLWNLTYDKNGNLQTLDRNGRGEGLAMDQLAYTYALDGNGHKTNNRLLQVTDEVNTSAYHTSFQLPAGQGSNNYSYNAMGQLTGDALEGKYYTYYANGRVKAVHADAARTQTLASFTYDAAGNRLLKVAYATDGTTPTERTWYLRDGSGGVMSYAIEDVALQTTTEELPIAGVGSYLRASLRTRYEVSDHLGNTRVSFTTDGNGDVLVIEAHDYYPHGGLLPGRQLSGTGGSPLAYQGQEYDPEVGLTAFNLRQYDGRIGRWLTTDPYGQHHSPYLAMSNNPVSFVDPDGGYDQRDRLIDEIWDSGLGLSAAFSNWDEY
ncbi:MAG: RHS repeat-associated core domain-containing protein [Flavobacteriales bacterium]|nr:RHS repeat-associated core domain-containing protein [Flavobacteriales bacterium]